MTERYDQHPVIWLQPWCQVCAIKSEGRMWCQDNVWDGCEVCGAPPVKYQLAKDQPITARKF